ncbi:MAG: hypothetical protein ACTSR5_08325, partial [Promethearchaeota archaeon]
YGFFMGNQAELLSFFGMAEIRGGVITFELFETRGTDFLVPFLDLVARNGVIWVFIVICSFLILVFGILGLFSIIYASFSDARNIRTGMIIRSLIPHSFWNCFLNNFSSCQCYYRWIRINNVNYIDVTLFRSNL